MLTELQKARTRFHLGYPNDQIAGPRLEVEQNLVLGNLNEQTELALVGADDSQTILFAGQSLCAPGSLLSKLETAWDNLGPENITDSLFVSQAGSVTLRRDELKARVQVYQSVRVSLANLLNVELFGDTQKTGPHHCY